MTKYTQSHFEEAKRLRNLFQISPSGRNDEKMPEEQQNEELKQTSSVSASGPVGERSVKKELLFDCREFNSFSF